MSTPKHEEELLRLVQSGLPQEELRAEITRRWVRQAEEQEPAWGALLRAAAIPRRLDEATIGVLRGAPEDEAGNQAALQRLADLPFVLPDPEDKSYGLHELTRAVLLEDWQTPERRPRYAELSQALWAHFRERNPLEALYHRFVADPAAAFDEFERRFYDADVFYRRAECGALLLAAEAQAGELDEGQQLWLRHYRARLARLLDRWAEAEEGYRELLTELPSGAEAQRRRGAGEQEAIRLRTWTLHDLGIALQKQGKWAEALGVYEESLAICRELSDRHGEGKTLNNMGGVYQSQGRWAEALDMYEQSLAIKRALGDRHGEGQTLTNMGGVYQAQGRWAEALDMYEQSLAICQELGDRHGEGQTLNNMGVVYRVQGRWAEALDMYEQSLAICRALGDRHGEGQTLNNMGDTYTKMGRWQEAKACFDQSLPIRRELGDRLGESYVLHNLGHWHQEQGQLEEAIAHYEKALAIRRELEAWPQAGETLHSLAEVYALKGDWAKAAEMARQAAEAWEKV